VSTVHRHGHLISPYHWHRFATKGMCRGIDWLHDGCFLLCHFASGDILVLIVVVSVAREATTSLGSGYRLRADSLHGWSSGFDGRVPKVTHIWRRQRCQRHVVWMRMSLLIVGVRHVDREVLRHIASSHKVLRWHARGIALESLGWRVCVDRLRSRGSSHV
jgi:hypothetical protein